MPDFFLHGVEVVEIDSGPRPVRTISSVIGVIGTAPEADDEHFPLDTPVLIAGSRRKAAYLGKKGTLPNAIDGIFDQIGAMIVVVRVAEGSGETDAEREAASLSNIIGHVDKETGQYRGAYAFLAARSTIKVTPHVLIAPGFTHQRLVDPDDPKRLLANPVVSELVGIVEASSQGIAGRIRGIVIADGPNTTDEAAIGYREDFGSGRVFVVDPWVKVFRDGEIVTEPSSARVAGLIAKIDNDKGFWPERPAPCGRRRIRSSTAFLARHLLLILPLATKISAPTIATRGSRAERKLGGHHHLRERLPLVGQSDMLCRSKVGVSFCAPHC